MSVSPEAAPPSGREPDAPSAEPEALGDTMRVAAKQSSLTFMVKVGAFGTGFAVNVLLARVFGATALGEYAIMQSVVTFAAFLSVFGIDYTLLKYVPKVGAESGKPLAYAVARRLTSRSLVWSVVVATALYAASDWIAVTAFKSPEVADVLRIGAVGLVPFSLIKVLGGFLRGVRSAAYFSLWSDFMDRAALLGVVGGFAILGLQTSLYVALAWLTTKTIVLVALAVKAIRLGLTDRSAEAPTPTISPEVRAFVLTMVALTVVNALQTRVDILLIGYFAEAADVGVYKIAYVVAQLATFFMTATFAILPTIISEYIASDRIEELGRLYATVTRWTVTLTLPVVLSVLVFPEQILGFFGPEYPRGASVLAVLGMGYMVQVAVGANGFLLQMSGRERIALINNVFAGIASVSAAVWLIPRYGIVGAAIASSGAVATISLVKVVQVKVLMGVLPYDRSFLPSIASGLMMVGVALLAGPLITDAWRVAALTLVNMAIGVGVALQFRSDLDDILIGRIGRRFRRRS